jgi:outer membrane receptor protein involved in Fe transport
LSTASGGQAGDLAPAACVATLTGVSAGRSAAVKTNLGVSHTFELPHVGAIKVRFDVINLFDEIYLARSSTSLGAFSPAYAPRRTFYAGVTKEF